MKLGPAVPGDLALDCFGLARDVRALDMQASPYDLSDYGKTTVPQRRPPERPSTSSGNAD